MKKDRQKLIWFDFDNSPHVPVLLPVARALQAAGYGCCFTARDVAQTVPLLKDAGCDFTVIGREFSAGRLNKLTATLRRALRLRRLLAGRNIACCVSHTSRSAIFAGRLMRKPVVALYDYEYVDSFFQNNF